MKLLNLLKAFFILSSFPILISCNKSDGSVSPQEKDTITVVKYFGNLHVKGNRILDKNSDPVTLRGMSLFWSQWGGSFYNEHCVKWLRDDWKCTVIRAAMGIESGGYLTNPAAESQKIIKVIDACINLGIYVIVDWHDHNAQNHLPEAKEFFKTIAQKYGDKPNIIYEIYNEPLQISWSGIIKPYAEEVIKVIRAYDADNLIIVGNPTWSQDVDIASKDPVKDSNSVYGLHYYAATHKQSLRNKAQTALNNGAALFVSEYGICESTGNGNIDYTETENWFTFLENNYISSCNWSLMDKNETSSALITGATTTGNWKDSDLSASGKYIRNFIISKNTGIFKIIDELNKQRY